jgi:hypothetical protein
MGLRDARLLGGRRAGAADEQEKAEHKRMGSHIWAPGFGTGRGKNRSMKRRLQKKCVPLYKGWGVNIFGQKSFCLQMWADISS